MSEIYTGDDAVDLRAVQKILQTEGDCALDFETDIATAREREICTIQVTHSNGKEAFAYVYPNGMAAMKFAAQGMKAHLIAFNSAFESECLAKAGVMVAPECAMIAAKVLRGTMEGEKTNRTLWNLKAVVKREFDRDRDKSIRDEDWRVRPTPEMVEYGMDDTRDTLDLWNLYKGEFDDDVQQWNGYSIIADSLSAIAEINLHGLPFNPEAHNALIDTLSKEKSDLEFMLSMNCLDKIDNHGSTKQVAEWMMDLMLGNYNEEQQRNTTVFSMAFHRATGQHWPLTKTGAISLGKKIVESRLESLWKVSPDVAAYLTLRVEWSRVAKLLQSFGPSLAKFVDERGYVAGSLKPHGAQTSRMSMVSPNTQQMPAEPEFRALFKAKKGRKLVIADYSQIELRVGCIICDDKVMQEVFRNGEDIHQASADRIKQLQYHDPSLTATSAERKKGKSTTFGALYGAGPPTIALSSGLSLLEAANLLDLWLGVYSGIKHYRSTAFDLAKSNGGVRLVSGQFLRIAPDSRAAQTINAPVQGSAASVMYLAMTLAHEKVLEAREDGYDIWLGAVVHDEIVLDCAEGIAAKVGAIILEETMTEALVRLYPESKDLGMANIADASIVDSWAEKD